MTTVGFDGGGAALATGADCAAASAVIPHVTAAAKSQTGKAPDMPRGKIFIAL